MLDTTEYFDLGKHTRPISTASEQAQMWFDRGLNWLYGFNQEESVLCFKKAAEIDPDCAMAYWGMAYAAGPFYNMPWEMFSEHEALDMLGFCYSQLQKALSLKDKASSVEQALIQCLTKRFPSDQPGSIENYALRDDQYAAALHQVYQQFPDDLDITALFAEAMMTRTPWKLWNLQTGEVADTADTLDIIEVLEKGMQICKDKELGYHPGLLHLHIHVWEMSPHPERAMESARGLHDIQPDGGHLHHMPAHIYALSGMYSDALAVSEKAIVADRKYIDYAGLYNFYTTAVCHDLHMKMHAAMLCGLYQPAIEAANEMTAMLSDDVLSIDRPYMAATLEGYNSTTIHVPVRFGLWQQIVDTDMPKNPQLRPVTTAMYHYAKGIAHAALGNFEAAEKQKVLFENTCETLSPQRIFFNNPALVILAVAEAMLSGELEYHKGNYHQAFDYLRLAVKRNDALLYSEPWPWMHPPRHALGALLMEQGYFEEAEQVYRADLGLDNTVIRAAQHPDNVWSLHGFYECLSRCGESTKSALVKQRLDLALACSDVNISSSCCCRGKTSCC